MCGVKIEKPRVEHAICEENKGAKNNLTNPKPSSSFRGTKLHKHPQCQRRLPKPLDFFRPVSTFINTQHAAHLYTLDLRFSGNCTGFCTGGNPRVCCWCCCCCCCLKKQTLKHIMYYTCNHRIWHRTLARSESEHLLFNPSQLNTYKIAQTPAKPTQTAQIFWTHFKTANASPTRPLGKCTLEVCVEQLFC